MLLLKYIWLLLCYAQFIRTTLFNNFDQYSTFISSRRDMMLPISLGVDKTSGCTCRANKDQTHIVCFGSYDCKTFPKVNRRSEALRVRTSVIKNINEGALDYLYYLKILEIEANHQLLYLIPCIFRNLTNLEQLSISYNTQLKSIDETLFKSLRKLKNLTMVNNGFTNIYHITAALQPQYLPVLQRLDISENMFESISHDAFSVMNETTLNSLKMTLCQIDFIHHDSMLPLKHLTELYIGENDLDPSVIEKFIRKMIENEINLMHLDISSMGFRKSLPKMLLDAIAESTIKILVLSDNKFETIPDNSFPQMINIELLDLRRVFAVYIGPTAFNPQKFPNLKTLFLGGNNLPGIYAKHLSTQLKYLDISHNSGNPTSPVYFEIARDTFLDSGNLKVLNLSYTRIKSIFDYTFNGLNSLEILNMENATLFHIGPGSFLSTCRLQLLNLANNPLCASQNLSSAQFEGLIELKVLILNNCGIRYFHDRNIFQVMSNITHLILKDNLLMYVSEKLLRPLTQLEVLDLSGNLLITWQNPIFLTSGIKPQQLLLVNNKITYLSEAMLQDLNYLVDNETLDTNFEIYLMNNIFVCDCNNMYTAFKWLEINGSMPLKRYMKHSIFKCSAPNNWENRRVADYFSSLKLNQCVINNNNKLSELMTYVWTLPLFIVMILILVILIVIYKCRYYIRYWIFLAKLALGRTLKPRRSEKQTCTKKVYRYDAFVSYCNEDREFVLKMICELEGKLPFLKLCVYERDFEVGSLISDSIMSGINDSKYVVLIISNKYAKSHWCRWETQIAEYHRLFLEDGSRGDPLVLVRVGDVESKYLTPTLKYLLKTKIYLPWHDNDDQFWSKLRHVLSKDR